MMLFPRILMFSSLNANHNGGIEYKGKLLNWFNLEIGLRMSSSFLRRWSRSGLYSKWVDHIFLSEVGKRPCLN